MQEIMEIRSPVSSMRLYSPPTFEQWFDRHQFDWRRKNGTFRERPSKELIEMHQRAIVRHLKWQGTLIKEFMKNQNGKHRNGQRRIKTYQDS